MTIYTPGTQIRIRRPCSNCIDGKVELPGDDRDFVPKCRPVKLYHKGYCPTCHGQMWVENWVAMEDLTRWTKEILL